MCSPQLAKIVCASVCVSVCVREYASRGLIKAVLGSVKKILMENLRGSHQTERVPH